MFFLPKASLKMARKVFSYLLYVFRLMKSFCASVVLVSAVFEMVFMLELC